MSTGSDQGSTAFRLMEALDGHDDVQNVYCNLHMTDEVLAEAE
jgi:hypothetical protein